MILFFEFSFLAEKTGINGIQFCFAGTFRLPHSPWTSWKKIPKSWKALDISIGTVSALWCITFFLILIQKIMYISNGYYMVWKTYLAEEHTKSCIVEMELKAGYGFSHTHTEILSIFFKYLFLLQRQIYKGRQRHRECYLPTSGSLQMRATAIGSRANLGPEARGFLRVYHTNAALQGLRPSFAAFPEHRRELGEKWSR